MCPPGEIGGGPGVHSVDFRKNPNLPYLTYPTSYTPCIENIEYYGIWHLLCWVGGVGQVWQVWGVRENEMISAVSHGLQRFREIPQEIPEEIPQEIPPEIPQEIPQDHPTSLPLNIQKGSG